MSGDAWLHELSGVTVLEARLRIVGPSADAKPASRRRRNRLPPGVWIERCGSLLFTHFGLSGPAAMDVSHAVTAAKSPRHLRLVVDFLPMLSAADVDERLRAGIARDGRKQLALLIGAELPRRLAETLVVRANVPADRRGADLSNAERLRFIDELKNCVISLTGTRGFDKAEVTTAGVALDEVDSRDMQSKLVPNLYLAGEILELDGFIGGYNFQAAFSTGWLAGENV